MGLECTGAHLEELAASEYCGQASDPRQGLIQAQLCLHKPWLHSVPLHMCIVVEANCGVRSAAYKYRAGRASSEYVHGGVGG